MSEKKQPEDAGRLCFTIREGESCKIGDSVVTFRRVRPGGRHVDVMVVAPKTTYVSRKWPCDPGHEPKQ